MLYPSIDKLLEMVDSKYTLVVAASKRARYLNANKDEQPLIESPSNVKNVGIGLEEIYKQQLLCHQHLEEN